MRKKFRGFNLSAGDNFVYVNFSSNKAYHGECGTVLESYPKQKRCLVQFNDGYVEVVPKIRLIDLKIILSIRNRI